MPERSSPPAGDSPARVWRRSLGYRDVFVPIAAAGFREALVDVCDQTGPHVPFRRAPKHDGDPTKQVVDDGRGDERLFLSRDASHHLARSPPCLVQVLAVSAHLQHSVLPHRRPRPFRTDAPSEQRSASLAAAVPQPPPQEASGSAARPASASFGLGLGVGSAFASSAAPAGSASPRPRADRWPWAPSGRSISRTRSRGPGGPVCAHSVSGERLPDPLCRSPKPVGGDPRGRSDPLRTGPG